MSLCPHQPLPGPCNPGAPAAEPITRARIFMIRVTRCRCCFLAWLRVATSAARAGRDGSGPPGQLAAPGTGGSDLCVTAQPPSWLVEARLSWPCAPVAIVKAVLIEISPWRCWAEPFRGNTEGGKIARRGVIHYLEVQGNECGTVRDVGFICLLTRCRSGLTGMVATYGGYRPGQRSVPVALRHELVGNDRSKRWDSSARTSLMAVDRRPCARYRLRRQFDLSYLTCQQCDLHQSSGMSAVRSCPGPPAI
jgi:hypothetical protein